MIIKPGAIPYVGNKQELLKELLPMFPDDVKTFYDVFCGGLSVSLNVPFPVIAMDVEAPLVEMYHALQKRPNLEFVEEILREHNITSKNEDSYLRLRKLYNEERCPLYLYVLLMNCFCNMYRTNKAGGFNTPFAKGRMKSLDPWIERHHTLIAKKNLTILNSSYSKATPSPGDFVYCDPPYLITGAQYNSKWKAQDDRDLYSWLDSLDRLGVRFGLSNVIRHNNLMNDILMEWSTKYTTIVLDKKYKMNQIQSNQDLNTVEVYVCNYPVNTTPTPEVSGLNLEIFM